MMVRLSSILAGVGATFFAGAGVFTAAAVSQGGAPPPTKTVTINVATGPAGPRGPQGPQGPAGPAGSVECLDGYSPGILVINHPGGHTSIYTCIEGQ